MALPAKGRKLHRGQQERGGLIIQPQAPFHRSEMLYLKLVVERSEFSTA